MKKNIKNTYRCLRGLIVSVALVGLVAFASQIVRAANTKY